MADVRFRQEIASNTSTVANPAFPVLFGDNFLKHTINQSDVGRELIVSFTKAAMTNDDVTAYRNAITLAGGAGGALVAGQGDAFTVAAIGTATGAAFVSGVTGLLFMRVQGTGEFDLVDAEGGVAGTTVALVATFVPAL